MDNDISTMTKDDLAEYALGQYGVELDKRKKIETLRAEVQALGEKGAAPKAEPEAATSANAAYLKHRKNGRVFVATPALIKRGDMIPCDAKGDPV